MVSKLPKNDLPSLGCQGIPQAKEGGKTAISSMDLDPHVYQLSNFVLGPCTSVMV